LPQYKRAEIQKWVAGLLVDKYRSFGPKLAAEKDEYLNSVCCSLTLSKKSKIQTCKKFFPTVL